MHTASRYHDVSFGHRVHNHESKCANLHGHNYRFHFDVVPGTWHGIGPVQRADSFLDDVGRVVDFSVIKSRLCQWLEDNWDHRFLVWNEDPLAAKLSELDPTVVLVTFNPTAENIAEHMVRVVGPRELVGLGIVLESVTVEETRKCSATFCI